MSRRPSRRKPRPRGAKKLTYKQNWRLHAHEDEFVLALVRERRCVGVHDWVVREPGRWSAPLLGQVIKRLLKAGKIRRRGFTMVRTARYEYNHSYTYEPTPETAETTTRRKVHRG